MASSVVQDLSSYRSGSTIHRADWRQSILQQLQVRKTKEQAPFEDICSFASSMFERVDYCKSENIQLNLEKEKLQQELLRIQQTILGGGSNAAKTILSELSHLALGDRKSSSSSSSPEAKNFGIQHATLLTEKAQLEKKILELQENLAEALKSKSDTVQKIIDLKNDVDDKDRQNQHLKVLLEEKEEKILYFRRELEKLDKLNKMLKDENLALQLSHTSLDKKFSSLRTECDTLRAQILAVKREDADRLNAENERIIKQQQERARLEIEAKVSDMDQAHAAKLAAGDPSALALAEIAAENFEQIEDDPYNPAFIISRVPQSIQYSFDGHEGEVFSVNWYARDGYTDDYLATGGGSDRKVKIWKISDSESCIATLLGSNASITSIDLECDSLLASSNDFAARIWMLNSYRLVRTLTGHSAKVMSAKFLGVPNKVATGSHDRTIKIWDVNPGCCLRTYFAGRSCNDVVYNSYQVISGHTDSVIRCWDLKMPDENEPTCQINLESKVTSLDVSKDGTKILCSLRDNTIKCLDVRRMGVLQTYTDEKFKIGSDSYRAKFSNDGQLITCGSNDGSLYLWDTNSAKVEKILTGHNAPISASCWSPDGKRMVSIGKKISIWA